jgi:putative lipoprotein
MAAGLVASGGTDGAASGPTASASLPLGVTTWRVDEIDGQPVQGSGAPTVTLDGAAQRVSGSSGCNRYTAALTVAGSELRIGDAATTRMACSPAVMELESRFVAALAAVRGYRLDADALQLLDERGRVLLHLRRS